MNNYYYEVAVTQTKVPVLTYSYHEKIASGSRVVVTVKNKKYLGIIISSLNHKPKFTCLPIVELIDKNPIFSSEFMKLLAWMTKYYNHPLTSIIKAIIPSEFFISNDYLLQVSDNYKKRPMTERQKNIVDTIEKNPLLYSELRKRLPSINFMEIKKLQEENIITIHEKTQRKIKEKVELRYYLTHEGETAMNDLLWKKKYPARYNILQRLSGDKHASLSAKDLGNKHSLLKTLSIQGLVNRQESRVQRTSHLDIEFNTPLPEHVLTKEQRNVYQEVHEAIMNNEYQAFLLHGVTGSGKTEVYIQLVKEVIKRKKSAVILVPEIALTPKLTWIFRVRLNTRIEVLHSGLSSGEKFDAWHRIIKEPFSVVIGVRSAVFCPVKNPGIVIVDEEHEQSYKQSSTPPHYHAGNVAVMLAFLYKIPILLGSATPSAESWYNSLIGKYKKLDIKNRVNKKALPQAFIKEIANQKKSLVNGFLSLELFNLIKNRLEKNEQVILFLNRRGYAPQFLCQDCGESMKCPNCDITLNYHKHEGLLKCHYCRYLRVPPSICPSCGSANVYFKGFGLQKIEEELKKIYPKAGIIRMDQDTTRKKHSHYYLLKKFENHEYDILIGTQMITKGLDFPNVTLVGVIMADIGLNLPDFRASEKTFNLLTQVIGRAGRGEKEGKAVIQTYDSHHYCLVNAKSQDYHSFIKQELKYREALSYPPYNHIILISGKFKEENFLHQGMTALKELLNENDSDKSHQILGPSESMIKKQNNLFHYHILVKTLNIFAFNNIFNQSLNKWNKKFKNKILLDYDVDPQSIS